MLEEKSRQQTKSKLPSPYRCRPAPSGCGSAQRGLLADAAAAAIAAAFLVPDSAFAIPSPDVIVNVFASAGQVLGLLSVVFGATFMKRRKSYGSGRRGRGRGAAASGWLFTITTVLLLVSIGANVMQYTMQVDADNRRLSANLTRPSIEKGKKVGDINLRTLSMSDQVSHPAGLSTEDFAKMWRFDDFPKRFQFIDVRTPEEYEMGYLSGARHLVQPDLRARQRELLGASKPIILLCESGNRSGELCEYLNEAGASCQFVIGGFQKWVDEDRPTEGVRSGQNARVRDIADYPQKNILLDTPEVQRLVQEEDAIFVDVRYPGDFELGHLPDAINIPIRQLRTEEWNERLAELPKKPIIAPCYDKRSCFYAMIIGLRIHRASLDFRGRYTVPHEYVALDSKSAMALRMRASEEKTFVKTLRAPLEWLFTAIEDRAPSFLAAIVIFILVLRLLLLPPAVKNERDQFVLRVGAGELEELKRKTAASGARQSRALMQWYKQNRITPVINLLGSLLQMMVFLLCFFVVQQHGQAASGSFLWLSSPSALDPYCILPGLVSLLAYVLISLNPKKRSARVVGLYYLACLGLFALTFQLSAAVNFYLVVNLTLLVVQNLAVGAYLRRKKSRDSADAEKLKAAGVLPLTAAHKVPNCGNKSARLGLLIEEGFPVPNGLIVTDNAFGSNGSSMHLSDDHRRQLRSLIGKLSAQKFAVRSSGSKEDGEAQSYAGVFESLLNIEPSAVEGAVEEIRASFVSDRAKHYCGEVGCGGSVLIQEMVSAEYAGVLFTEHPSESGACLVELTAGLGDDLVSGNTNALGFRYGRASHQPLDSETPPIPLEPLLALGRRIEQIFERPQDIEWAYNNGKFAILQARDITVLGRSSDVGQDVARVFEQERHRVMELAKGVDPHETVFEQNELCEMLPNPTPLSLSLMDLVWRAGGTADLACEALGVPYDAPEDGAPLYTTLFGTLYLNRAEANGRAAKSIGAMQSYRLSQMAEALEDEFRNDFLPSFDRQMDTLAWVSFAGLETPRLVLLLKEWVVHFIEDTYVEAEKINVAADFYLRFAEERLRKRDLTPSAYLADLPPSEPFAALALLPYIREGSVPLKEFINRYGHRTFFDFELSSKRFNEDSEQLESFIAHYHHPKRSDEASLPPLKGKMLTVAVQRARKFQALKEDAKHYTLKELAFIRKILVELDSRWNLEGKIFYFNWDELLAVQTEALPADTHAMLEQRAQTAERFKEISLPSKVSLRQLETIDFRQERRIVNSNPLNAALAGLLVAGNKEIIANARVVREIGQIGEFQPGEILVTRFTNPQWTPLFSKASGIVTEVGGWLSHAAILAREYNLTTVVGVSGAVDMIRTGDKIKLCLDGTIEQV